MSAIALYICLVGAASVVVGLTLQMIGGTAFSSFGGSDTKELAGVAGIRIAAIFGIAVGLIFSSSNAHYTEAKKDLFEEVRLIGTIYTLVARSPDTSDSRSLREKLRQYVQASAMEMDQPEMADQLAISTNETLIEACEQVAREFERQVSTAWFRAELQRLCDSSIDLRGKKRVRILVSNTDVPFWIFFAISFALFGVLVRRIRKAAPKLGIFSSFLFRGGDYGAPDLLVVQSISRTKQNRVNAVHATHCQDGLIHPSQSGPAHSDKPKSFNRFKMGVNRELVGTRYDILRISLGSEPLVLGPPPHDDPAQAVARFQKFNHGPDVPHAFL